MRSGHRRLRSRFFNQKNGPDMELRTPVKAKDAKHIISASKAYSLERKDITIQQPGREIMSQNMTEISPLMPASRSERYMHPAIHIRARNLPISIRLTLVLAASTKQRMLPKPLPRFQRRLDSKEVTSPSEDMTQKLLTSF